MGRVERRDVRHEVELKQHGPKNPPVEVVAEVSKSSRVKRGVERGVKESNLRPDHYENDEDGHPCLFPPHVVEEP